jgi:hypothetical protein
MLPASGTKATRPTTRVMASHSPCRGVTFLPLVLLEVVAGHGQPEEPEGLIHDPQDPLGASAAARLLEQRAVPAGSPQPALRRRDSGRGSASQGGREARGRGRSAWAIKLDELKTSTRRCCCTCPTAAVLARLALQTPSPRHSSPTLCVVSFTPKLESMRFPDACFLRSITGAATRRARRAVAPGGMQRAASVQFADGNRPTSPSEQPRPLQPLPKPHSPLKHSQSM